MDSSNLVGVNFYPLVGDHKPQEFSIPYFEGTLRRIQTQFMLS